MGYSRYFRLPACRRKREFFNKDLHLMDWLRQYVPDHVKDVDEPFLRGFLGKMLFARR